MQTAVVGVRGYAGGELARLLLAHPGLRGSAPVLAGREGDTLGAMHPRLAPAHGPGDLAVEPFSWELMERRGVELLFLATPHEQSREWVPEALARGLRVVDLSGAWRLEEPANRRVYTFADEGSPEAARVQARAVYGMPELHAHEVAGAELVANPGCYATAMILALKPLLASGLVDLERGLVCDSKSGVSGAGREATAKTHFVSAADNLSAYGVFGHRHTGELVEQLGITASQVVFTPHLLPIPRGILATSYVWFRDRVDAQTVRACYEDFYRGRQLVRLYGTELPQIAYSVRTNFCDIGWAVDEANHRAVVVSCLDNLLKGAASQAVQNMNLMLGWDEAWGLVDGYVPAAVGEEVGGLAR